MRVQIKFRAPYDKLVGEREIELELESGAKVKKVLEIISQKYPRLAYYTSKKTNEMLWSQIIIHLNDKLAKLGDILNDGDTLGIFPPISGG